MTKTLSAEFDTIPSWTARMPTNDDARYSTLKEAHYYLEDQGWDCRLEKNFEDLRHQQDGRINIS